MFGSIVKSGWWNKSAGFNISTRFFDWRFFFFIFICGVPSFRIAYKKTFFKQMQMTNNQTLIFSGSLSSTKRASKSFPLFPDS
jgi:hypothetical protein